MLKVIELFAGIGAPAQALTNLGIAHSIVGISEIDKYAIEAYNAIHGEVVNYGDIAKIDGSDLPKCDLMTFGFPCQDISIAGAQQGLAKDSNTRSSLLWEATRIIQQVSPSILLMENVKNLINKTHLKNFELWLLEMKKLGYSSFWQILNASDFGVPQNRERVFCILIKNSDAPFIFPKGAQTNKALKDVLDEPKDVPKAMWMDDKPYIPRDTPSSSESGLIHIGNLDMKANEAIKRVYSIDGFSPTLTTMEGGHRQPKILLDGRVRKLTPRECWRLMGFTDEQFDKVKHLSNTQLYKLAGNSICVPCLEAIFKSSQTFDKN